MSLVKNKHNLQILENPKKLFLSLSIVSFFADTLSLNHHHALVVLSPSPSSPTITVDHPTTTEHGYWRPHHATYGFLQMQGLGVRNHYIMQCSLIQLPMHHGGLDPASFDNMKNRLVGADNACLHLCQKGLSGFFFYIKNV